MSKMSFNPMRFIADNAGLNILEVVDKAYEQGRADEKRDNEQDAYHRGYLDGKIKCSFENERKIRADERKRIIKELEEQNKWHLCSEELPNESGEYLCYMNYDGNKFYNIEEIDCDGFFKEWNLSGSVEVIAWRELPKFEGVE